MSALLINVENKPPLKHDIDAVVTKLKIHLKILLAIGVISAATFIYMYAFDTPMLGKSSKHIGARAVDWWMASSILISLGCAVKFTNIQFALQLLQPITKESLKTAKKLGQVEPKIAAYIKLVNKEGRDILEAELKTFELVAQGEVMHTEKF